MDCIDINRIIKEYYGQPYSHKLENLDKMDPFIERHNLPKFTQGKIDYLNRFISIKENESIINNPQKQKAPGPDGFTGKFY